MLYQCGSKSQPLRRYYQFFLFTLVTVFASHSGLSGSSCRITCCDHTCHHHVPLRTVHVSHCTICSANICDALSLAICVKLVRIMKLVTLYSGRRGSSVSIVSDYGLDNRAIGVRSPAEAKNVSFRPALRPTQAPVQWVPAVISPRV
jgi:hypothetical protein